MEILGSLIIVTFAQSEGLVHITVGALCLEGMILLGIMMYVLVTGVVRHRQNSKTLDKHANTKKTL
jgi:hypothetical protein